MKNRIVYNWTFSRILYLGIGLFVVFQSIHSAQWFGVIFGGYFAAMGLFAFGCASGKCAGENCSTELEKNEVIKK